MTGTYQPGSKARAKIKRARKLLGQVRYNEADERVKVQAAIRNNGVDCWPLENKVAVGMSDTYIDGGNWLEFKHLVFAARTKAGGRQLLSVPEAKQREFMGRHVLRPTTADRTFLGFLIQPHDYSEAWLLIARFDAFCHPFGLKWTLDKVREFGCPFQETDEVEAYVGRIFSSEFYRNSDFDGEASCLGLDLAAAFT